MASSSWKPQTAQELNETWKILQFSLRLKSGVLKAGGGGGSLPGQQAFPACEAAAAVGGGGAETKPSMRNVGGVMIKTRKDRRKRSKMGKLNKTSNRDSSSGNVSSSAVSLVGSYANLKLTRLMVYVGTFII